MSVLRTVVVDFGGEFRHGAVASVAAKPDGFTARGDAPAGPEGVALVKEGARASMLAGEAGYKGCDSRGGWWSTVGDFILRSSDFRVCRWLKGEISLLPPVEFGTLIYP